MEIKTAVTVFTYLVAAGFLGLFAVVVTKMVTNRIDLASLLQEPADNKASLSRFQFLVFTLVIAGLYVVLSIENGQLIDVPAGALSLLGISGGSYLVSKSIGDKRNGGGGSQNGPEPAPVTSPTSASSVNVGR